MSRQTPVKQILFPFFTVILSSCLLTSFLLTGCGGGSSGGGSSGDASGICDGQCAHQSLLESDVRTIVAQSIAASHSLSQNSTISVVDRVGNVLAVYQMDSAPQTVQINGRIGATGGLEGLTVPSVLAAISKAGTGAFLSSQGNAFSSRTASQIVQEHFDPGQNNQPGGPLFGVQLSQFPCSDLKDSSAGPRSLPLGLSADPGGIPLYKGGDLVGGLGIESDGLYSLDRNIEDYDDAPEERIALAASHGFEVPAGILAERITVGGQALRFADSRATENATLLAGLADTQIVEANVRAVPPFTAGVIHGGATFGISTSGIAETTRAGVPSADLVRSDGSPRYPARAGSSLGGLELTAGEVNGLLDSALVTAYRARAAIRRPLSTAARVSIFVVDTNGTPLGFTRSQDAPIFGIDVALQKARTAAFFSSADANTALRQIGLGGYVDRAQSLFSGGFDGSHAFTARSIGNLSRPFFPDGIDGNGPGPLSLPFPGTSTGSTWSPFNTGFQLDLIMAGVAAPLSGVIPSTCSSGTLGHRLGNGIQIFSGAVPLYRNGILIGAIGVSGDGIFQDDMVAFYGASRKGLAFAGHAGLGDPTLGFNAPPAIRSDTINLNTTSVHLRYVNCPESPFTDTNDQNVCEGL